MLNVHKKLKATSIEPPPPWVDLPVEITIDILQRLGTVEIMESAQRVCSTWWKACHDPAMWRVVHLKYDPGISRRPRVLEKIRSIAVDRSQGQLLKISIENFGTKDFFNYIFERSTQLRHLRVFKGLCSVAGGLVAAIKNFPFLEELHIYFGIISEEDVVNIGRSCPLLKSFIMNASGHEKFSLLPSPADDYNALARAIAISMPELRHLALLENSLTDVGFQAILDGCPHLELLDLHRCNNFNEGELGRRCRQQIVDLKQLHAPTLDYEFDSKVLPSYCSSDDDHTIVCFSLLLHPRPQ